MQIGGIGGISPASGLGQIGAPANPGADTGNGFGALLDSLTSASTEADGAVADLAVGGDKDLHDVVLSVEMESLAFDLAVQIRNRLVEAYSEVFRMQV
ncbi:MAG: flagellar hook-basal body complex protein FliE [Dehalococcoidia bacterium]